jgi:LmbE family N-acetylglucosaminyl deacetylase
MVTRPLHLLSVGGHPADAFDSAGGTLAHHVQRGDQVTVVALTQGTRIHDVVISDTLRFQDRMPDPAALRSLMDERAAVKEAEVRRACAFLGIDDVRFFGYDDAAVTLNEDLIGRMAKLIREVRPDIIVTHHPHELGGVGMHHASTGQLVLAGVTAGGSVGADDPNPPHRVAQIFFTVTNMLLPGNVLSAGVGWYPDLLVDITDVIEAKVRALDAMRSQQYGGNYARKATEYADGAMGAAAGVAYAEGFVTYWPEFDRYFPLSEERLERTSESEAARRQRADRLIVPFITLDE